VNRRPLEGFGALQTDAPRLERADAGGENDRSRIEARARHRLHIESAILPPGKRADLLAQMHPGLERLDLLEQALDEFLGPAHRQRRNIVNRLLGVQLRALSAGPRERIDDVGTDSQQAEFEDLKQSAGPRSNDENFSPDRRRLGGGRGRNVARHSHFHARCTTSDKADHCSRSRWEPHGSGVARPLPGRADRFWSKNGLSRRARRAAPRGRQSCIFGTMRNSTTQSHQPVHKPRMKERI